MSSLNAAWHLANKMPKNAAANQRIQWHADHTRECGCRPIPAKIQELTWPSKLHCGILLEVGLLVVAMEV